MDQPGPLQPGQRLIVEKPGGVRRDAVVARIGEKAEGVTVEDPGVVGGSYKRDVVLVLYEDGEVEAVEYRYVTVVDAPSD